MPEPIQISLQPLPKRSQPKAGSFDTSPSNVMRWIKSLPLANQNQSARRIYKVLNQVNRLEIDAKERFQFLEKLRHPVRQISEGLEASYVHETFPLSGSNQQAARINRMFQEAMALGYTLLAQDLTGHRLLRALAPLQGTRLCPALHRALCYQGQLLLSCCQVYAPYPENTWREINHLYTVAVDLHCANRTIKDDHHSLVDKSTIENAYKQILLFSLARPYRLRPGEYVTLFNALELWAPHCRLSRLSEQTSRTRGLFAVQPDTDLQPTRIDLHSEHPGHTTWILDTTALARRLRRHISAITGGHGEQDRPEDLPPDITTDLLRRVMTSWGMLTERIAERRPSDGDEEVEVVLGLPGVHAAVSGKKPAAVGMAPEVQKREEMEVGFEDHTDAPWDASPRQTAQGFESHRCRIHDSSSSGFGLQWLGDGRLKLKIGSLIWLRHADPRKRETKWAIGTVQWMQSKGTNVLEFGVEVLATRANALEIRLLAENNTYSQSFEALRLPAARRPPKPSSLVTEGFLEHLSGAIAMTIYHDGTEKPVMLTKLIESTGAYARFEYTAPPDPDEASEAEESDSDSVFDSEGEGL